MWFASANGDAGPVFLEAGKKYAIRRCRRCVTRQLDEIVGGQVRRAQPETLPHQSSKPVTADSQAHFLLGNREAQTWPIQGVLVKEDCEKLIRRAAPVAEYVIKVGAPQQAQLPGEMLLLLGRSGRWRRSDRNFPWDGWRQTVSRARPFARRRFKTSRPARVAMRARNPWVRTRFSLLGW